MTEPAIKTYENEVTADIPFPLDSNTHDGFSSPLIHDVAVRNVVMEGDKTAINAGTIGGQPVDVVAIIADTTANIVPVGLAIASQGITTAPDGTQSAYVVLSWTAISATNFDHYIIRYKKHAYTYYTQMIAGTTTITIDGLVPNTAYDFGLCSVNKYGIQSAFCTDVAGTTTADTAAPATVSSTSATAGIQYIILEWTANTETDLASYNIYRNTTNNSATATLIGNCRTNYFVDGNRVGGTTYYYFIKAVDTSGNVSAAFSTVQSATPRNVTSDDIVTIAGSKVLIDGAVYLSNWRKTGDLTKIDGGSISANTITTTQLNFTPIQGSNVIASINASAEGIKIDADNLTINAATTFGAGYDPTAKVTTFAQDAIPTSVAAGDIWIDTNDDNKTYRAASAGADEIKAGEWILLETTKVKTFAQSAVPTSINAGDIWIDTDDNNKMYRAEIAGADQITAGEWVAVPDNNKLNALGGSYDSAASGARVRIFPDANTGIQVIDDAANDVFKVVVGGTNVGDVIVGNYGADEGFFYDKNSGAHGKLYLKADLAVERLLAGEINSKIITMNFTEGAGDCAIKFGKTDFGQYTTPGLIMGFDDSDSNAPKLEITGGEIYGTLINFYFGDGLDGNKVLDGNNDYTGITKVGSVYTLTRDFYFNNLTVSEGCVLNTAGYAIYGLGTLTRGGTIQNNGGNGGNGANGAASANAVGGSGGVGGGEVGSTFGKAADGGAGGTSQGNVTYPPETPGGDGTSKNPSLGTSGAAGGQGGMAWVNGSNYGHNPAGGTAGVATAENLQFKLKDTQYSNNAYTINLGSLLTAAGVVSGTALSHSAGSGGGGTGGPLDHLSGGGGGGAGGNGGIIYIAFRTITGTGLIQANGGNGGDGGRKVIDGNRVTGAGGGGAGGNGGVIVLIYKSGTPGTLTVGRGNGGNAGASSGGSGKQDGTIGNYGKWYIFHITA